MIMLYSYLHMKNRLASYIFLSAVCLFYSSCSSLQREDEADAFVGTYKISVIEHVVWGNDSGNLNDSGILLITKVSANRVKTSGFFSTFGEVTGSFIYFESVHTSDSSGYIDEVYGQGMLSGNILNFTSNGTGKLRYNGVLYPWRRSSRYTAIKQQ